MSRVKISRSRAPMHACPLQLQQASIGSFAAADDADASAGRRTGGDAMSHMLIQPPLTVWHRLRHSPAHVGYRLGQAAHPHARAGEPGTLVMNACPTTSSAPHTGMAPSSHAAQGSGHPGRGAHARQPADQHEPWSGLSQLYTHHQGGGKELNTKRGGTHWSSCRPVAFGRSHPAWGGRG